jgi:rare lipoprotein A
LINPIRFILPLTLIFVLAACGGAVKTDKPTTGRPKPATSKSSGTVAESSASAKSGGYYLDDGPGDNPPPDIDSIPDAVPHAEALLARANRPYSALGTNYTPMTSYVPYKQSGVASWYGKRYHGQKTSSGEIYDMYGMTGAHATLPLPSYVRVTNPENGRSVIVRINDRGPFHSDRLIDLSYAAAYKLRLLEKGSGKVEVEAIDTRAASLAAAKIPEMAAAPVPATPATEPAPISAPVEQASGSYVQVGAFKYSGNADHLCEKLREQNLTQNGDTGSVNVASWYNEGIYHVRLGPYTSHADAEKAAARIKQMMGAKAIVIDQ